MTGSWQHGPGDRIPIHVDPELRDIVPGFLDRRLQEVDSIRAALERQDYGLVRGIGHQMKGAGSSYGFDGITEVGWSLEEAMTKFPILDDGVTVSAGARVLGPIVLGAGVTVGANAVVINDVPPGVTVVGVPARPVGAPGPA